MAEPPTSTALMPSAFASVLDRAQRPLWGFLRGLLGDDEQARDLTRDVFCDAWRVALAGTPPFLPGIAEEEQRRWLFHDAYNRAISALRRRRLVRWQSLDAEETLAELPASPRPFEDRIHERLVLDAALASLSVEDAACLLLNTIQGYTATEVAEIIASTPDAAKRRLSRAKQRLRAAYFAQQPADEK